MSGLAAALIFAAFVFYSLFHLEPIRISGGRLVRMGSSVVVQGTATNTASDAQAAGLKLELFDGAGRKLAVQDLALGKLAPGQHVDFVSRPISASAVAKFTILVDRGANMYGN